MNPNYSWYQSLVKPSWAPPGWLFAPVWTILYILIAISFGFIFYSVFTHKIKSQLVSPFVLNLIFNLIFTPIQFGLKNNYLAALDILLVLVTLVWALKTVFKHYRWVALVNVPYLLWVGFATILQLTVTFLNK
jgi:tryptophan-rich sensory protein